MFSFFLFFARVRKMKKMRAKEIPLALCHYARGQKCSILLCFSKLDILCVIWVKFLLN